MLPGNAVGHHGGQQLGSVPVGVQAGGGKRQPAVLRGVVAAVCCRVHQPVCGAHHRQLHREMGKVGSYFFCWPHYIIEKSFF